MIIEITEVERTISDFNDSIWFEARLSSVAPIAVATVVEHASRGIAGAATNEDILSRKIVRKGAYTKSSRFSNRTFLAGKPYAGLRAMLRERFDRIEIIDLRGDVRRGERAGVTGDQGVFNIQVGTAITLAIADRSKEVGALARVSYIDTLIACQSG